MAEKSLLPHCYPDDPLLCEAEDALRAAVAADTGEDTDWVKTLPEAHDLTDDPDDTDVILIPRK